MTHLTLRALSSLSFQNHIWDRVVFDLGHIYAPSVGRGHHKNIPRPKKEQKQKQND